MTEGDVVGEGGCCDGGGCCGGGWGRGMGEAVVGWGMLRRGML